MFDWKEVGKKAAQTESQGAVGEEGACWLHVPAKPQRPEFLSKTSPPLAPCPAIHPPLLLVMLFPPPGMASPSFCSHFTSSLSQEAILMARANGISHLQMMVLDRCFI